MVAAYFERLNAERWTELLDLFHEDAELAAPGGRARRGRAAIEAYYRTALAPYPEHLDAPGRVLADGDAAAVEIRFTGRLATGATIAFDAVDVFDVREGRIARLTSWYDSHGVRRALAEALALEPPAGGAGGAAEATPARARAALALVRRGEAFRLDAPDGGGRSAALAARAVLVDAAAFAGDEPRPIGPSELEAAAGEQGVELRPGDALLVRTGRPRSAPGVAPGAGWVRERRLSAVASDGPLDAATLGATGVAVWERLWLEDLAEDCAATGIWDGLLVAAPPGGAVVLR